MGGKNVLFPICMACYFRLHGCRLPDRSMSDTIIGCYVMYLSFMIYMFCLLPSLDGGKLPGYSMKE